MSEKIKLDEKALEIAQDAWLKSPNDGNGVREAITAYLAAAAQQADNPVLTGNEPSLYIEGFLHSRATAQESDGTFQERVQPWMMACFGPEISTDRLERNDRFIEEALELVQASDYPKDRAHQLVEYVYGRDQGEINQEVGGVMVTLAAHCLAHGVDMHEAGETELARIWTKVEQIRAKQAAKPKGSALPIATTATAQQSAKADLGDWVMVPRDAMGHDAIREVAARFGRTYRSTTSFPTLDFYRDVVAAAPAHPAQESVNALVEAAIGLRDDLLVRAEIIEDDGPRKIVCASNDVWQKLNAALAPFQQEKKS